MTDQAENLRRLVQAQRDWKELAKESPAPPPVEPADSRRPSGGIADWWKTPRNAGSLLSLGMKRKPGRLAG
jgi:hypothetical protein